MYCTKKFLRFSRSKLSLVKQETSLNVMLLHLKVKKCVIFNVTLKHHSARQILLYDFLSAVGTVPEILEVKIVFALLSLHLKLKNRAIFKVGHYVFVTTKHLLLVKIYFIVLYV